MEERTPMTTNSAHEPVERCRTAGRDFDIWKRYSDGETQQQIGDSLDLDQTTIGGIIRRLRDDVPLDERRARQRRALAELDELRAQCWTVIDSTSDAETRLKAMDRLLKVQEREARALGTDAPRRFAVEAEEVGARVKALLRRVAQDGAAPASLISPDESAAGAGRG
jgi:hypothetical protein